MARPKKQGINYFPHDTNAINDEKIRYLISINGIKAYAVYFIVLESIYKNGSTKMDDIFLFNLQAQTTMPVLELKEILKTATKIGLFDKEEFKKKVLISNRISKTLEKVEKERNLAVLRMAKNEDLENQKDYSANNSSFSGEKLPNNGVIRANKTIKGNERKEKEVKEIKDYKSILPPQEKKELDGAEPVAIVEPVVFPEPFKKILSIYPENRLVNVSSGFNYFDENEFEQIKYCLENLPENYKSENNRWLPTIENFLKNKKYLQINEEIKISQNKKSNCSEDILNETQNLLAEFGNHENKANQENGQEMTTLCHQF